MLWEVKKYTILVDQNQKSYRMSLNISPKNVLQIQNYVDIGMDLLNLLLFLGIISVGTVFVKASHASHHHLLTPPPHPHIQTNIHTENHTLQIHHARTGMCTDVHAHQHMPACMHAHTPPHPTQYICNHEGMIIFPIRYSNIAPHMCY